MKIKKTVGMACMDGVDRKSYIIHTECGEEIECLATGAQGFTCAGMKYKSIKEIKQMIEDNDDREEWQCEPDEVEMNEQGTIWDCVHPCAFLIRWTKTHSPESLDTLNNYGWLDENGKPDVAKADREFTRVENLTGAQSDDN